jgi:hypothetical protein
MDAQCQRDRLDHLRKGQVQDGEVVVLLLVSLMEDLYEDGWLACANEISTTTPVC